jgi:hypothetical protein
VQAGDTASARSSRSALLVACLVAVATIAWQDHRHQDDLARRARLELPGFDSWVYAAMAQDPAVFTVAPWGYRILTPLVAHALLGAGPAQAFRWIAIAGLAAAGVALYLLLRRLGHGAWPSVAAVAAFGLSPPVSAVVEHSILTEPLTVLIEVLLLLAIEAGAGIGPLAFLFVLAVLSKEVLLALVPLVWIASRRRVGSGRALLHAAAATAPAVAAALLLRLAWVPHLGTPRPAASVEDVVLIGFWRIVDAWPRWLPAALVGGLLPAAALGALTPSGRRFVGRYGFALLVFLALPFAAGLYSGGSRQVVFFDADVPRLLLYAVPLLLPLALGAAAAVVPHWSAPAPPAAPARWASTPCAVAAAGLVAFCLFFPDRYRRLDLGGLKDGRLVYVLCRQSVAAARRLEEGRPVQWREETRFEPRVYFPELVDRMRWFLRDGWGDKPHYGTRNIFMTGQRASLLLPSLEPRPVDLSLVLSASSLGPIGVEVNGRAIGSVPISTKPARQRLRIPAEALFRGDNIVALVAGGDSPAGIRFRAATFRAAGGAAEPPTDPLADRAQEADNPARRP